MQPGFVDFQNFAQGFGFAGREAVFEAKESQKSYQVGFRQGCGTRVDKALEELNVVKWRLSVEEGGDVCRSPLNWDHGVGWWVLHIDAMCILVCGAC